MVQKILEPQGMVLFEPQDCFQEELKERQRNCDGKWTIHKKGLGSRRSTMQLSITQNKAATSLLPPSQKGIPEDFHLEVTGKEEVEVHTLDELMEAKQLEHCDFIKLDVQGYESEVLRGGRRFLKHVPRMVVEVSLRRIYEDQELVAGVLAECTSLGFQVDEITEAARSWPDGTLWQVDLWLARL